MVPRAPSFLFACYGLFLNALLSTTCHTEGAGDIGQRPDALVAEQDLRSQLQKYQGAHLYPHPSNPHISAANCEVQTQWWGRFCVFHHTGDRVDWVAKVPFHYLHWEGDYVVSLKWWHLPRLHRDVLQVVTSTHRGNGFLWLFALEGHELRPLLETCASGFSELNPGLPVGTATFTEPIHFAIRTPPNRGATEIVRITATIIVHEETAEEPLGKRTIHETWSWNPRKRIFELRELR